MDSEKINQLLDKYWTCETTLEEEKQLQEFFRSGNIPDSLADTATLFQYFDERRKQNLTDVAFDAEVLRKIKKPRSNVRTLVYNGMRIAAGIIVLFLAVWLVRMEVRKTSPQTADTYDDPKMAFEETKKALMMISKSFNTAEEQAKKIDLFNEAQRNIQKETPAGELQ